jgi:alpha-tubulin suppressor-like RCC1 family protein
MKTKLILHSTFCLLLFVTPRAPAQTIYGSALSFNGTSNYVAVTIPALANNYTFAAWVYLRAGGYREGPVGILSASNCNSSAEVQIGSQTASPSDPQYLEMGRCLGFYGKPSTTTVPTNQWVHIAVSVSSDKLVSYFINGSPAGSTNLTVYNLTLGPHITLGDNTSRRFNGMLDEVQIWNKACTVPEIQALYSFPLSGTPSNLLAYWKFDEIAGTTAYDATTNHLDGTLVNSPARLRSLIPPRVLALNGANPCTNQCHVAFTDPGATVTGVSAAIGAGYWHSLALKADRTVIAWGNNSQGQTNTPASLTNALQITAGYHHNLALRPDGTVVAWGYSSSGQTNVPAGLTNVVAIAGGDAHSLALKADGTVTGWGNTSVPTSLTNVVGIAAGAGHSLALRADGTVLGWGDNTYHQTNIPGGLANVVAVSGGGFHSLALRADGTVIGWGYNAYGQTNCPASATNVAAIAAGFWHNLALRADGTVIGWGDNSGGQTNVPASATNVVAIAAGGYHSLALRADGTLLRWGNNTYGQTNLPAALNASSLTIAVSGTVNTNSPGAYLLTYNATNVLGVIATATRTVQVADTLAPALTLLGDNPLFWQINTPFSDPGATASDLCAGNLTGSIVSNITVNISSAGLYTNTYTVTDAGGNSAQTNRTVLVFFPLGATTLPPSGLLNGAATLNGSVNAGGLDTAAWFEWGHTAAYGSNTPPQGAGSGTNAVAVSALLDTLTPGATYHCRCVASNSVATVRGVDQSFWLPALNLNGANPMTNECHYSFSDPGAATRAFPMAIAAGRYHSLGLRADGTVAGWGLSSDGQTTIPASATNVVAIAAGSWHSLALRAGGAVVAWGKNDAGQTNAPASATNVVAVAAGDNCSLALRADGTVVGWGENNFGQTTIPAAATNVVAIAAGLWHSLALRANGTVVGWGDNGFGAIPASATNVVAIAAGWNHSLALRADGMVVGWGRNDYGQATIPASATNVVAIAGGGVHSLALRGDGTVVGWGYNYNGQTTTPVSATNVVAIAAGGWHSLALRADGTVFGWGANSYGQITIPTGLYMNLPITVSGMVDTNSPGTYVLTYSTTNTLGAAAVATRTVEVVDPLPPVLTLLGDNPLLWLGDNPFVDPGATATDLCAGNLTGSIVSNITVNIHVPGLYTNTYTVTDAGGNSAQTNRIVQVPSSSAVTLPASGLPAGAATLNGSVTAGGRDTTAWFEWGFGCAYGSKTPPQAVGSGTNAVAVSALLDNWTPGATYHYRCVASNSVGTVHGVDQTFWLPTVNLSGSNAITNECHFTFDDPGATVSASLGGVAAGWYHSLALRADGTVVGWGLNYYGQVSIPASATNAMAIAAGALHSLALRSDGTVVGWGFNDYDQITIPAGATNVVAIAAGYEHSLALRADGTLVGWGGNNKGQTTIPANVTNVVAIAAGNEHSLALRADGTVVGWGSDESGQATIPASTTNVVAIAAGYEHSMALRADGTLVGWGGNKKGQTTIPANMTNVVAIAAGNEHNLALRTDGTLVGWGNDGSGQASIPASATNILAIAAGGWHNLALRADGTLVGWGWNDYGQTNTPAGLNALNLPIAVSGTVNTNSPGTYVLTYSTTNALGAVATATRPVEVVDSQVPAVTLLGDNPLLWPLSTPFVDPGATATDLCSGNLTGSIVSNITVNAGVMGNYTNTYSVTDAAGNSACITRTVVVGPGFPSAVTLPASGLFNGLGTLNGSVNARGSDTTTWFECGMSSAYGSNTPPQSVGSDTNAVAVSASSNMLTPGVLYHYRCVASNSVGTVRGSDQTFWLPALTLSGSNRFTNECHFAFVDPGTTVKAFLLAIAESQSHCLALRADRTVAGWGDNYRGQTIIPAGATNVVAIAAGYAHSLALRSDGTVVGWGFNSVGQTIIPAGATNLLAIAACGNHSLALRADGTVIGWGDNSYGQTNTSASASNVVAIAAGYWHSLALRADGTVVGWGNNAQTSIPANATNVMAIAGGLNHSLALRTDGTIVGWGGNTYGQITIPSSATNVVAIAAGTSHSLALRGNGTVVGWGENTEGQTSIPANATNVVAIAAGHLHSLALRGDGTVIAWGYQGYGQNALPAGLYNLALPVAVGGTVVTDSPGTYVLTYSVTNDLSAVTTATRTVEVVDTLPPMLTLLGNNPLLLPVSDSFTDPGAAAIDICTGDLTGSIVSNITVNPRVLGTYTNTYTVTDGAGISARTNRVVLVRSVPAVSLTAAGLSQTNVAMGTRAVELQASVNPNGLAATAFFRYGLTTAYLGNTMPVNLPASYAASNLTASLDGVIPGVTYHWNVYASNALGVAYVPDQTFSVPPIFAPGDVNGDGVVDQAEFSGVLADLNGNGIITQDQLNMVLSNYFPHSPWLYITNAAGLGSENVTFALTNSTAGAFSVWMTTNLADWEYLGPAIPRYGFFDTNAPAIPQRFYRLSWP